MRRMRLVNKLERKAAAAGFLASDGKRCPWCHWKPIGILSTSFKTDGGVCAVFRCVECEAEWTCEYEFTGISRMKARKESRHE